MNKKNKNAGNQTETHANLSAGGGIRFFGKMTASATHEIKNALAIINESAGLLEDLSFMAEKGHSLTPARIQDISKRVTNQVQRADLILQKLNRFSHSADRKTEVIDFERTVCFMLKMASRLMAQQEIVVEVSSPLSPLLVATNLFYLENLIWRAIEVACCQSNGKKRLHISFGTDSTHPSIWFSMESLKTEQMEDFLDSPEDKALLAHLNASIVKDNSNNSFGLIWPKQS